MDDSYYSFQPFSICRQLLKAIEKGVRASPMELNPKPEATAVLVPVPTLTQEVRQNMIKVITKAGEAAKVRMNSRVDLVSKRVRIRFLRVLSLL